MREVTREELVRAVDRAARELRDEGDKSAVRHFARNARKFAAGAWECENCLCPVSGAALDRNRSDVNNFAEEFDYFFGVNDPQVPTAFVVVALEGKSK